MDAGDGVKGEIRMGPTTPSAQRAAQALHRKGVAVPLQRFGVQDLTLGPSSASVPDSVMVGSVFCGCPKPMQSSGLRLASTRPSTHSFRWH